MTERRVSVLEACTLKLGQHRGALAAANVAQYAIAWADLGEFPTAAEYADYWAISERSAWRHRARIEAALGDQWQDVVRRLARQLERAGERSPRAAMQLRVTAA